MKPLSDIIKALPEHVTHAQVIDTVKLHTNIQPQQIPTKWETYSWTEILRELLLQGYKTAWIDGMSPGFSKNPSQRRWIVDGCEVMV